MTQLINQTHQAIKQPNNSPINRSINKPTNQSNKCTNQLPNQSMRRKKTHTFHTHKGDDMKLQPLGNPDSTA